ncbi:transposase, IS4 family protein, partial [mine drainage metagenome]
PGSDRAAEKWKDDYAIEGVADLELHHLYRAMAWLGEPLPKDQQDGATPFAPRTNKDRIEEACFSGVATCSDLEIVFFDTTSIYFEGEGGETIGQRGHSKDHRPDRKQMVVGMVLDRNGNPVCSELWPGNTADVKSLVPIVERLQSRFGIGSVCIVADRGMISAETLAEVERRKWSYILGVRMRSSTEAKAVVARGGRYAEVHPKSDNRN